MSIGAFSVSILAGGLFALLISVLESGDGSSRADPFSTGGVIVLLMLFGRFFFTSFMLLAAARSLRKRAGKIEKMESLAFF